MPAKACLEGSRYQALCEAGENETQPQPLSSDDLKGGAGPAEVSIKLSNRVSQTLDEDGLVLREQWIFDEDAYTLALIALTRKKWRGSVPEVLLSILVPVLQMLVFFMVLSPVLSDHSSSVGIVLPNGPQTFGIGLCVFQLADEAAEGLHKVAFSARYFLGFYDHSCLVSAGVAIIMSALQLLAGLCCNSLSMIVILSAETALDVFMNFFALSFMLDLDNMMLRSRLLAEFVQVNAELTMEVVSHRKDQQLWPTRMMVFMNSAVLLFAPVNMAMNESIAQGASPPLHHDWLSQVPQAVVVCIAVNLLLFFGSQKLGLVAIAWLVTLGLQAAYIGYFVFRFLSEGSEPEPGCRHMSPLSDSSCIVYVAMLVPTACSCSFRLSWTHKWMPLLAQTAMVTSFCASMNMIRSQCA